jgi:hypothetical protein
MKIIIYRGMEGEVLHDLSRTGTNTRNYKYEFLLDPAGQFGDWINNKYIEVS